MKHVSIFFLFALLLFLPSVFAQNNEQSNFMANGQSEETLVETSARKALQENAALKEQNENLKKNQTELENQINFLNAEISKIKNTHVSSGESREQAEEKLANNVDDSAENKKVSERQRQDLKEKLAGLQEQTPILQKEIDYLQAQKQSLVSFNESASQKQSLGEMGLTGKTIEALEQEAQLIKVRQDEQKNKVEQSQKALDLVFASNFENQEGEDQVHSTLADMLDLDQTVQGNTRGKKDIVLQDFGSQKSLDNKKIAFDRAIKQLQDFSSSLDQEADALNVTSGDRPYQSLIQEKNNTLIQEMKSLRQGQAENDFKVLGQRLQALTQLGETSQMKNQALKDEIDKIAKPQQKILADINGLIADEKSLTPQDLERQELFLKEQIQIVKEQNQKLNEALKRPEAEQQERLLKTEQRLQDQVSDLEAENKILNSKIANLNDNIGKGQKEKDLLESLLKEQKKSGADLKASDGDPSSASSPAPSSGKSLWKVPEILEQ